MNGRTHSNYVLGKGLSLLSGDALTKDGSRVCIGREGPSAKRNDSLDVIQALEIVVGILQTRHIDIVVGRDVAECKVLASDVRYPTIHYS